MDLLKSLFKGDKVIWTIFLFLCLTSIIEVFSAASTLTYKSGDYWAPISQHSFYLLLGAGVVIAVHKLPCKLYRLLPVLTLPLSLVLLVAVMFAPRVNEAGRWLSVGGIQFQPSEFGKMAVISSIALILSIMQEERGAHPRAFKWVMAIMLLVCGLIAPENASTAGMLFGVGVLLMYIGRVPLLQLGKLLGGIIVCVSVAGAAIWVTPNETLDEIPGMHRAVTWKNRVKDFSSGERPAPEMYDIDKNGQVAHAHIAVATSHLVGKMPGNSVERDFLSQAFSDFIYAIIIEELGLVGGAGVALLYVFLLIRAGRIAGQCDKKYLSLLVMGIALLMVTQALVNMMVAVGLFPVTGQPLPLISKGGTSTFFNCAYIGIILGVSRYVEDKKNAPKPEEESAQAAEDENPEAENEEIKTETEQNELQTERDEEPVDGDEAPVTVTLFDSEEEEDAERDEPEEDNYKA